jgi:hypothetical protein
MKAIFALVFLLFSSFAFAKGEAECKKHVADNIGTFSICHNSGTTEWNGKAVVNFSVKSCTRPWEGAEWTCLIEQNPWPSSSCEIEVVLDSDCYFNKSARITKEGREDI